MKFIKSKLSASGERPFVFQITLREKAVLLATLKLYPMLDAEYHQLSRDPKATTESEKEWLCEAIDQQQHEHKKKLDLLFNGDQRFFKDIKGELCLTLNGGQVEWLLRVLNDVRVGSWVRLGSPDMDTARRLRPTSEQARLLASMELSGYFQSALLEAFA